MERRAGRRNSEKERGRAKREHAPKKEQPERARQPSEEKRTRGRPRAGTAPDFDQALLEQLLIHGEFATDGDGAVTHRYPSYRELAERFGVGATQIHRFAQRHNCLERRAGSGAEVAPPATAPTPAPTAAPRTHLGPNGEPIEPMLPTIREIFVTWVRAVQDGEVRIASAGEIEKMMKIAADLDAEAQMRAMIPAGVPTLDELQDLHEKLLREYEATTPAMRGEVPIARGLGNDDEERGAEAEAERT